MGRTLDSCGVCDDTMCTQAAICELCLVRLVAERERLLWLACRLVYVVEFEGWENDWDEVNAARRILYEHDYDPERIHRMAGLPEPAVPR